METQGDRGSIGAAFLSESRRRLAEGLERIRHAVDQLDDDQLWWRSQPSLNSIANLMLHVAGNLRQWIVSGVGQQPDIRDRPREFAERGPIPKADLLRHLEQVVAQADAVLAGYPEARLLESRRIQGFDETALSAIFHSLAHLHGHAQEIILITRSQLGDAYRFAWAPTTPEQGAGA